MKPLNLVGEVFGRLEVIERALEKKGGAIAWICQCSCGNTCIAARGRLRSGETKSCGCLHKEKTTTHGMTNSPEYKSYYSMKQRCTKPTNPNYKNYGARGIAICDRWLESFENFYEDMGPRPDGYTLDRIDNSAGYCPENCKWSTISEQNKNRRPQNKYKGVSKNRNKFAAKLKGCEGKTFSCPLDAAVYWDSLARKEGYAEGWLNFPYYGFDPKKFIEEDEL